MLRPVNLTMASLRIMALSVLMPLLASCASSGFYNMSDDWCSRHLDASASRCPSDAARVAANDVARPDSALQN